MAVVAVAGPGNDSPTPHTATLSALRSRHARGPGARGLPFLPPRLRRAVLSKASPALSLPAAFVNRGEQRSLPPRLTKRPRRHGVAQGPFTEGPARPQGPGTTATPSRMLADGPGPDFCLVPRKAAATPRVSQRPGLLPFLRLFKLKKRYRNVLDTMFELLPRMARYCPASRPQGQAS